MSIRVALVEDDSAYRAALATILQGTPDFALAGAYPSGETALAGLPSPPPDVFLVDIQLPGMSGIDFVRALRERHAGCIAVMLTIFENSESLFAALMAGAHGYVLKSTPPAKVLDYTREAIGGGAPMSRVIARKVIQHFHPASRDRAATEGLSEREQGIHSRLATGLQIKEIATSLGLDHETVRSHLRNIYRKLHVHSRHEAVSRYLGRE